MELPLEGRVSNAFVEVGPSITLASLSEVLAFAVGSFIPMPACRVFSMFAGYCICCLDFLRAEDNRIDCFPCIKVSGSNVDPEKGNQQRKPRFLVVSSQPTKNEGLNLKDQEEEEEDREERE
ncbi:hypothetical protein T459_13077 [Capsicum annuum]|uniref:SSD domain-containing protein n=1 Tax=Capsicum annuum TaxID=4072 RepID=A0A2G2ZRQ2_CAPAN|nr:hypothetical protein T459_13077 [Capsicum annuum]